MNEKPKTNRGWRILRRILIVLAVLVTLAAVLVTEEDWRGKRAWENYKRELEAKGEKLDWQAFVPPAVPNNQNFFCAPIFSNILDGKIAMSPEAGDGGPDLHPSTSGSGYVIYREWVVDLKTWQNYYRNQTNVNTKGKFPITPQSQTPAMDVLLALSKYDPAIEELRRAGQRPYSNLPLNYEDGFNAVSSLLPDLAALKRCARTLQLRASAELVGDQSAKALDDIKLLLRLDDSIRNSPFLISHLVRFAIYGITTQPIWEGLAGHKWSDEQLVALDTELARTDFLADYGFAMRGERAFAIAAIENLRNTRQMISPKPNSIGFITNKLTFIPSAYFYQNERSFARMSQEWLLPLVDTNLRVVSLKALRQVNAAVDAEMKHYSPYKAEALMEVPALESAMRKFAIIQTTVDMTRIACALERYRLAHGEYPESLDKLAPQFTPKLPHDIINGQPLHYRRTDDGKFILYSVGWNEKDDGGTPGLTRSGSVDVQNGDWVWQYPTK